MTGSADRTLYRNGRVHAPSVREASALLVEDGVVAWLGDDDAAPAGVPAVDLDGAFVAPAFVDAHVHTTATGLGLITLDLSGLASLTAVLDAVSAAARTAGGRPVLAGGWDETGWPEGRPPTARELDRAAWGGSVYLARVDAHSAVVSSALMAAVPDLAGRSGYRADGWLTRDAHEAVRTVAYDALGPAQRREAQRAALRHAAGLGIACVHEMAGPAISSEQDLIELLALGRDPAVVEVIGYWGELGAVDRARELGAVGAAGDLFCDGSLGSHTAALHQPYDDSPDVRGALRFATAEVAAHVRACTEAGLQAGFHAIGDAAVDQVLDAVEQVVGELGQGAGAGHRLEHAMLVNDPARLAASGLLASVQPAFEATWGGDGGMYATRLGPARLDRLSRLAELAHAGVPLAFGSDAPVTPLAPWEAVRAAAYPHDPAAAISPRAGFAAHTRAGWRAAARDGEGVLAPGAPATFAVWQAGELAVDAPDDRVARWSTDPRAAVPGLPDVAPGRELPRCLRTVRRGVVLHDTGELAPTR